MENDYRQFGLLRLQEKEYYRAEYGKAEIEKKKQSLMKNRKLVLVLDLDNTLIQSTSFDPFRKVYERGRPEAIGEEEVKDERNG